MEGLVDGEGDDGMNVKMYMRATTDPASRATRRLDMTKLSSVLLLRVEWKQAGPRKIDTEEK
jgi:hypothetical protein